MRYTAWLLCQKTVKLLLVLIPKRYRASHFFFSYYARQLELRELLPGFALANRFRT